MSKKIDDLGSVSAIVQAALKKMDPHEKLKDLSAVMTTRAEALLLILAYNGFGKIKVRSTKRDIEEQCKLYGQGRTRAEMINMGIDPDYADPGAKPVSWVNPWDSAHLKGIAVDIDVNSYTLYHESMMGYFALQLGWRWGGKWNVFDPGHFEWIGGK